MKRPPNIVVILADDLGYGDVSRLNPESKIATHFMDRFASEGMTFTDAHSNSAVCTPTRYGILTGRYCWRGRLKKSVLGGYSNALIEPGRTTVASFLRARGYRTACIGKWHLGLDWGLRDGADDPLRNGKYDPANIDFGKPVAAGPHTAGFNHSFVLPASLDMPPYCYIEDGRVVEAPTKTIADSPRPAYWRGGLSAPGFSHETCLLEFTARAEGFVNRCARTPERPFFLYFPTPSPHTPHMPRPPFRGRTEPGWAYGDFVTEHDWSVGRVLAALERNGLAENTLVIVTSDNGAHCASSGRGDEAFHFERQYGHRSNHIYRGQKSDAWDGGHRIPFFARWPGVIAPGSACDRTICLTDLLATCAAIHGEGLPADAGEDSFDVLQYFRGERTRAIRESVVHHSMEGDFAIRAGDWKLIECAGSGGWSLPEEKTPADAPAKQLYNMADDPEERENLFRERPDEAARLQRMLDACRDRPATRA